MTLLEKALWLEFGAQKIISPKTASMRLFIITMMDAESGEMILCRVCPPPRPATTSKRSKKMKRCNRCFISRPACSTIPVVRNKRVPHAQRHAYTSREKCCNRRKVCTPFSNSVRCMAHQMQCSCLSVIFSSPKSQSPRSRLAYNLNHSPSIERAPNELICVGNASRDIVLP